MSLEQKFLGLFTHDPYQDLRQLLPELEELREDLMKCRRQEDSFQAIVDFFNAISPWHDRGLDDLIETFRKANNHHGHYDHILRDLKGLQVHLKNAGRDKVGMNRTKPGQDVTPHDVYLGGVSGLWTKSVAHWRSVRDDPLNHPMLEPGTTIGEVIETQAEGFMLSHIESMIAIIDRLEAAVRKHN